MSTRRDCTSRRRRRALRDSSPLVRPAPVRSLAPQKLFGPCDTRGRGVSPTVTGSCGRSRAAAASVGRAGLSWLLGDTPLSRGPQRNGATSTARPTGVTACLTCSAMAFRASVSAPVAKNRLSAIQDRPLNATRGAEGPLNALAFGTERSVALASYSYLFSALISYTQSRVTGIADFEKKCASAIRRPAHSPDSALSVIAWASD